MIPLEERFNTKWIPEPFSGCWLWTGGTIHNASKKLQYGTFHVGSRSFRAHRFSWTIYRGVIPDGLHVLHKCDTGLCVNPDHLFLGTALDNKMDCVRKKRHSPQKLTETEVKAIRKDTRLHRIIAADYGVARSMVSVIKENKYWRHIK